MKGGRRKSCTVLALFPYPWRGSCDEFASVRHASVTRPADLSCGGLGRPSQLVMSEVTPTAALADWLGGRRRRGRCRPQPDTGHRLAPAASPEFRPEVPRRPHESAPAGRSDMARRTPAHV